ncbi:MAG: hypothetical protein C0498_04535 [Anaerolinea sp.]|nr:hypothetical protein [Anaerolinea sp.]
MGIGGWEFVVGLGAIEELGAVEAGARLASGTPVGAGASELPGVVGPSVQPGPVTMLPAHPASHQPPIRIPIRAMVRGRIVALMVSCRAVDVAVRRGRRA